MRLGATLVHLVDQPAGPVADWAIELAAAGFDSLWTPHIIGRNFFVPDPFVTLAVAATVTEGIELGTATLQLPLFHPAELAHRILSLRAICGERLTLGLSPGSADSDYATLDRDYRSRFTTFSQHLDQLPELLPDPPPLLLGSWGANVERAARDFDGWLASGYRRTPDQIIEALGRYREAGGGRAIVCAVPVGRRDDLAATAAVLRRYADAGFDDAVMLFEPGGPTPAEVRALVGRTGS